MATKKDAFVHHLSTKYFLSTNYAFLVDTCFSKASTAASELGIPTGTIYTCMKAFNEGRLNASEAVHTPNNALSLNEELIELRERVKDQDKEIRRLKEENEFLEEVILLLLLDT